MTPKQINDFSQTFIHLWNQLGMPREGDSGLLQKIAENYTIMYDSGELEAKLPSGKKPKIDFGKSYVWLRPLDSKYHPIPVVALNCDFHKSPAEMSLRFALFFLNNQGLRAIGFRLETPHGQESRHSFCHAQMIRSFQKGQPDLPGCSEWTPKSEPAFPLDATCPFSLLICLMVALYGKDKVVTALSPLKEAVVPLKKIRDSMHLFR